MSSKSKARGLTLVANELSEIESSTVQRSVSTIRLDLAKLVFEGRGV